MKQLQLLVFVHEGAARLRELEQIRTDESGGRCRAGEVRHEDAIDDDEARAAFRQAGSDEDGDVGFFSDP